MRVPSATIQPQDPASVVRPLELMEHFFYLLDQASPTHFAVTAQIKGHTRVDAWRSALGSPQLRHPLFSVCIDIGEESKPYFRRVSGVHIPLRVINGRVPSNWETEIEKELALPLEAKSAPVVRYFSTTRTWRSLRWPPTAPSETVCR
jgi:hypothetical protein